MLHIFHVLTLAGLASFTFGHPNLLHEARSGPSLIHRRDFNNSDEEPCKLLSNAYKASGAKLGQHTIADVPPSVAIACLNSVPVDKERDIALIDYLLPFLSFHSTLEILTDPPETYLFPGVDILGGFEAVRTKLSEDRYESQYDVMKDIRDIVTAVNDNHFGYTPALLNLMGFVRAELDFQPISKDGIHLPLIFMTEDVKRGNRGELDYYPSAVESINGVPIFEWLETEAMYQPENFQDPDAQFNNMFANFPQVATGHGSLSKATTFEIPDSYIINLYNGSSHEVFNKIIFMPTADFTNVDSGEKIHEVFEIPPTTTLKKPKHSATGDPTSRSDKPSETSATLPGYPYPVVKHSRNSMAGYFLNETGFEDTAVLSILSFLPVGLSLDGVSGLNMTDFVLEGRKVVVDLIKEAKEAKRDKLIIDLTTNTGGAILLAYEIYNLLFPRGDISMWNRYRANEFLMAASEADYEALVEALITQSKDLPVGPNGKIKTGKEWLGPYTVKGGQNVTAASTMDLEQPWDSGIYFNGYDPENRPLIAEPPFKPENILIITDGTCASSCTILTGLLTRTYGIRTLALGGRPLNLAMQAMGGVKGTQLDMNSGTAQKVSSYLKSISKDKEALSVFEEAEALLPSRKNPPLLPPNVGEMGGKVNGLSGYTEDDLDGYPVHFRYEAANCRLFYTQRMMMDVSEVWRRAAAVAWNGAPCVPGSTVNEDGTIGNETVKYDSRVRSHAPRLQNLGSLY